MTWDQTFASGYATCQAAWPGIPLEAAPFRRALEEHGVKEFVGLHLSDLYLATACTLAIPRALAVFESDYLRKVPEWLASLRMSPAQVEEVTQVLRVKLLSPPSPKLADYSGRASLKTFLRTCAVNTALHHLESASERKRSDVGDEWLGRLAADGEGSSEKDLIRRMDRGVFKQAMQEALSLLGPAERNLLRFHYLDGLTLDEIAAMRGKVHKSTISREIRRLREQILDHVRHLLQARCQLGPGDLESLAGFLGSEIDLSLSRVLR